MVATTQKAKDIQAAAKKRYAESPIGKYSQQKAHANSRGVPFTLTFTEWWALWVASGKYEQRGKAPDDYCMCRMFDTGGYELGNVFIGKVSDNLVDQMKNGAHVSLMLTNAMVAEIFRLHELGHTQRQIAEHMVISQPHVSRILSGKRGKYFDKP